MKKICSREHVHSYAWMHALNHELFIENGFCSFVKKTCSCECFSKGYNHYIIYIYIYIYMGTLNSLNLYSNLRRKYVHVNMF